MSQIELTASGFPVLAEVSEPGSDMVRFVCISDTHSQVEQAKDAPFSVPDGDILIHAGDMTQWGEVPKVKEFNNWMGTLPHKHKVVIAGNHDLSFDAKASAAGTPYRHIIEHPELENAKTLLTNCIYLEDSSVTLEGCKIYGSPWQPTYGQGGGAFQIPRDGEEAREVADKIPADTDVLVTHGPPHGCQDLMAYGNHGGCKMLYKAVDRVRPSHHVFGHIHEAYGVCSTNGTTVFINAAICGKGHPSRVKNLPIVFDLPRKKNNLL